MILAVRVRIYLSRLGCRITAYLYSVNCQILSNNAIDCSLRKREPRRRMQPLIALDLMAVALLLQVSAAVLGSCDHKLTRRRVCHDLSRWNHEHDQGQAKRGTACDFSEDAGLVAITSSNRNGGWAILPDHSCNAGSFCPYECPSGYVMAQWDPSATAYSYPQSTNV